MDEVSERYKDKWYWWSDGGELVVRSPSPWLFDPDHELAPVVLPGLEPQRSLHARAELSKDVNHNAHQVDFCFEYDERMEDGRELGLCEMRQCTGR